jgi:hypothetical protein
VRINSVSSALKVGLPKLQREMKREEFIAFAWMAAGLSVMFAAQALTPDIATSASKIFSKILSLMVIAGAKG